MAEHDDITPFLKAAVDAVRVDALRALQVLDTPPEPAFDDLVWIAARLCDAPIALISLVDADRQWFKARCGIHVDETPREISFCSHAIEQDGLMEIDDAREDSRFASNPAVTGAPHVRFYAGAPLIGRSGHRYGTLCVVDTAPRSGGLTPDQREGLVRLARRASEALEARRQRIAAESREQTLASLLDALPSAVVTCSADGRLAEFNRKARDWHGVDLRTVPPDEWTEHVELYEPDGVTPLRTGRIPLVRALAGETVRDVEMTIRPHGRDLRHVLASGEQVRAPDGRVLGAVCVLHDVTETRAAQAQAALAAARIREAFDVAAQGMALVALDGRFLEVNAALCTMLGYTDDQLLQLDFQRLTHPEDLPKGRELVTELLLGKRSSFQQDKRYFHADGRTLWVRLSVSLVRDSDGRPLHNVAQMQDLTAQKLSEARLRDSEQQLRNVLEHSHDAFIAADEGGVITEWNRSAESTFGWRRAEVLGKPLTDIIIPPRMRQMHGGVFTRYLASGESRLLEQRLQLPGWHRSGHEFPVELSISVARDGGRVRFNAFLHDISERLAAEARLREREQQLRTVADNVPALIAYVDAERRYCFVNQRYAEFFGRARDAVVGQHMRDVLQPAHYEAIEDKLDAVLHGETVEFDLDVTRNGELRHMHAAYLPSWIDGADPARDRPVGFHLMVHDVTAQARLARVLEERAMTDELTGLPNRAAWNAELSRGLARAARAGVPAAVMFLDLDGFKHVNDTHGHAVGDIVLREFAHRLRGTLRASDFIARLSGDEFVVLLDGVTDPAAPSRIEAKVMRTMEAPMRIGRHRLRVVPSIGTAVQGGSDCDSDRLMREADAAMYRAKRAKALSA